MASKAQAMSGLDTEADTPDHNQALLLISAFFCNLDLEECGYREITLAMVALRFELRLICQIMLNRQAT